MDRPSPFFRGSELPRLALLAVVTLAGWGAVWYFARRTPPRPPSPRSAPAPRPPRSSPTALWSSRP
ncbi:hypothetical protein [Planctomyces sp. SH-PL62]|uniref:hypothetical protein n=1 Tax=Planctomyces sp. SH-PL62 TaxID=1636152 RepID=UPI00078E7BD8|nr:hypothetical protein [Planctomyces sp. SH-PL62]AMV39887.1 hypothetical protein VT85_20815 [Planctomyces sp. SH-PL62]